MRTMLKSLFHRFQKLTTNEKVEQPFSSLVVSPLDRAVSGRHSNYEQFREKQLTSLSTISEQWFEVFQGQIPKDNYRIKLKFGEWIDLDVASVYLEGQYYQVHIDFRNNLYSRLLNRDLLAGPNYSQESVELFSKDGFANTIYQVNPSRLATNIDLMSYGTKEDAELLHYVIVGDTNIVDVVLKRYFEEKITITVKRKGEFSDDL